MKYTSEQLDAIDHRSGNLQILACAGSGKTEVISRRIAQLIAEGTRKDSVIAFTFTERAADELKTRIRRHLDESLPDDPSIGDMYVGTIHSFCLRLLRELNPEYRKYEVMDEARQAALIMTNYGSSADDMRGIGLSRLRSRTRSKSYWDTIQTFITTLSVLHQQQVSVDSVEDSELRDCIVRYQRIAYGYPNFFFDFDEIIAKVTAELGRNSEALHELRHRLQHIVVDEYQDIDDRQEELISLLSRNGRDVSVTVVGDDDQAIYGWRGARIENMLSFARRYPNVAQVNLKHNFRSTHAIAEIAASALESIPPSRRLSKDMEARHWDSHEERLIETMATPGDVRVLTFDSDSEEAAWVAQRILQLRGVVIDSDTDEARAIDYGDMAILLRSVKGSGMMFVDALHDAGIPVIVKGTGGLFGHHEVQLVHAAFCLLARSEMLLRIDGQMTRFVEAEIRDFVRDRIRALKDSQEEMAEISENGFLRWIAAKREELDKRALEQPRRGRLARRIYPQDIFHEMLKALGSDGNSAPWSPEVLHNLGRLSRLIADFETVHQWITPYDLTSLCVYLGGWAASQVDEGGLEQGPTSNAVQILTVHAAKGLEWPVVFVPRVASANFPSSLRNRGPTTFLPDTLANTAIYAGGDEGERRLWYVALTRCRRFLNVSSPDRRNKRPTAFLREIEHDIVWRDDAIAPMEMGEPKAKADTDLLPTTYTELSYFWRCPFEYQLRALMGFEPGVGEQYGYGQQIHNVLAEVHERARNGETLSPEEVSDLVEQRFHLRYTSDGDSYKPLTRLRDAAKKAIRRYLEHYSDTTRFVLEAEKPFEFIDHETGALVSGTVDLIQRVSDSQETGTQYQPVIIVDFKAHRWSDDESFAIKKMEAEAQLRLYAVAVGKAWNLDAKEAFAHFLSPTPPSADLVQRGVQERVSVDVSQPARLSIQRKIGDTVSEIQQFAASRNFPMSGIQNGSCRRCDFRTFCPGFERWKEADKTTPRPPDPEAERQMEMSLVEMDVDAG